MKNKELRDNYQRLLHESYHFDANERKCILEVIDRLEEVLGKERTDNELATKCKAVYQILREKELFKEFVQILRSEKKLGSFSNTTY